jgi:hypothetical protein
METRQIVRPGGTPPANLPTFNGAGDANRFRLAQSAWDVKFLKFAATTSYANKKVSLGVPTSLSQRQVYADICAADGGVDVGWCLGEIKFYNGGTNALTLPFEFMPGAQAGNQEIGFHATSSSLAATPGNTLGVDIGTTTRLFIPPWLIRINCSQIEIILRAGTVGAVDTYVVLGCLSQPAGEDLC